ncbi:hypothetical protein ACFVS2_20965 [Brevibacillus sp. NPDC058079]|uniref:hypothetical protein n=1 Tax=Brevibacillus sp. NPDC058079 TaxID=3346330 RepID=UPI0036EAB2F0
MMKAQKKLIISIANEANLKGKAEGLSSEDTITWFTEQMKHNRIPSKGWFAIDDEIRKEHENAEWFWIIRMVRNNLDKFGWALGARKIKVLTKKTTENRWMSWAIVDGIVHSADIIAFEDQGFLGAKKRFRVDVAGKTVHSMIDHFQTAKSIAGKHVKEAYAH